MNYREEFISIIKPILKEGNIKQMEQYIQHRSTTTLEHCIAVSYISFCIAKKWHIKCDYFSLVRGALLHDYFLYDWHEKDDSHKWHGFNHARKALQNAVEDFDLTEIEKDIISKHMFPLNIQLPKYRESYIVCMADKICSSYEVCFGCACFAI